MVLFASLAITSCTENRYSENEGLEEVENETDGIEQALEQEFRITKDPALNYVPSERLRLARDIAESKAMANRTNAGLVWQERGPRNIGGRTRAILVDKNDPSGNTVFAGSVGGGIWKCTDFKSLNYSWTKVNDNMENLAITAIAQDPSSPNIMYAGTGEGFNNVDAIRGGGIYKSSDGGATWSRLPAATPSSTAPTNYSFFYVQDIVVTQTGVVYASCKGSGSCNSGGVQKSSNGGVSWTRVVGTYNNSGSCADAMYYVANDLEIASNGDLYVTTGLNGSNTATFGHVFKSAASLGAQQGNAGNWTEITPTPPTGESGFRRIELAVSPSEPNKLYLLCQKYNTSSVTKFYSSANGGTSWTAINVPTWCDQGTTKTDFTRSQAWYDLIAAYDPNNSSKLLIGGIDVMASADGGSTFNQLTRWSSSTACGSSLSQIHADIHNIVYMNGSSTDVIVSNDGGVFYSANGGTSFSNRNLGYNVTQYYAVAMHPTAGSDYMLAGAQDNGSHRFTTAGINTVTSASGGDGGFCFIDQLDPTFQITSYVYSNYYISRNSGTNFSITLKDDNGDFINPGAYDSKSKILYCSYTAGQLGVVTNIVSGTPTLTPITVTGMSSQRVSTIKVDPNIDNRLYIGAVTGVPKVIRIDNANIPAPTYTSISIPATAGTISSIDVEEGNQNHLLVTLSNYGVTSVYESIDAGANWTNIEGDLPDMPVRGGIFIPSGNSIRIALATELGVWSTTTPAGQTTAWLPDNIGLANVRTNMIRFRKSDNTIAVATHGRGVFTTQLSTIFPVTMHSFTGKSQGEYNVLNWQTSSESNTSKFEVERSDDGLRFRRVGTVTATGNSNTLREYNFTDKEKAEEINYYRLKVVDRDSKQNYSKVITIKKSIIRQDLLILNNPVKDKINIKFAKQPKGVLLFSLSDLSGKIIISKSVESVLQNVMSINLAGNSVPSGTYILTIRSADETVSKKVVKIN